MLEVSPLLRELVAADGHRDGRRAQAAPALLERSASRLGQLALDELRRAAPLRLGIDLPQDKRLRALCEAVLADPMRHGTLDGWAREAGASARTVARLFRQRARHLVRPVAPAGACWHARSLAAAQGKPMAVIAADLGYASPSAFSAMVRRSVGAPPSRFFATG